MNPRNKPRHAGPAFVVPAAPAAPKVAERSSEDDIVPPELAEEAAGHGAPAVEWWLARSAGADIGQASALAASGPSALLAVAIAAGAGPDGHRLASVDEIVEAAGRAAPYAYLTARGIGLGHEEAMTAAWADVASVEAAMGRFSKADVLAALAAAIPPWDYATYRRTATHEEALEAYSMGARASDYALASGAGATHAEIVAAVRSGSDLWDYTRRKNLGLGSPARAQARSQDSVPA